CARVCYYSNPFDYW
nr:immunoglobulin heavy chain junction region [Mus musculus]MBK4183750.1 immunoglobulin heavy chain junction region [Mus musculus]